MRALRVLREADLIACEDTRRTRALLTHFDIHKPTVSYYEHNKLARGRELMRELAAGRSIALVTDAGTPGISDPGVLLVREARAGGFAVVPIPGPSASKAASRPTRRSWRVISAPAGQPRPRPLARAPPPRPPLRHRHTATPCRYSP